MSNGEFVVVERCPVCEPLSYYEGKSGLKDVAGPVCDMCTLSLNHYAIVFDGARGTHYFPVTTEIVECEEHAKSWNLLLWDSPFSVIRDGCNFVFERPPAIPMKALLGGGENGQP